MPARHVLVGLVVVAAVAYAVLFYGLWLGAERDSAGVGAAAVLDGVVTAALVCAAWALADSRRVAVTALAAVAVIALGGLLVPSGLATVFARSPLAWALMTVLAARAVVAGRVAERAER